MTMMGEEGDQRRQSDFEIVEFLDEKTMNLDEKTMMMVEEEGYQSKRGDSEIVESLDEMEEGWEAETDRHHPSTLSDGKDFVELL
jgi:hypothetical protein